MYFQARVVYARNNAILTFGLEAADVEQATKIAMGRIPAGDMTMDIMPMFAPRARRNSNGQTVDDRD